jgi:hypothetical protein
VDTSIFINSRFFLNIMTVSLIQQHAERDYRTRVQSFVTMSAGLAGFGTFIAGTLSELVGVQWAV